jgi:hypothetical protein
MRHALCAIFRPERSLSEKGPFPDGNFCAAGLERSYQRLIFIQVLTNLSIAQGVSEILALILNSIRHFSWKLKQSEPNASDRSIQ